MSFFLKPSEALPPTPPQTFLKKSLTKNFNILDNGINRRGKINLLHFVIS